MVGLIGVRGGGNDGGSDGYGDGDGGGGQRNGRLYIIIYDYTRLVVSAWFFYKESGWIKTIIFTLSMYFLGSLLSIGYILVQFFKLSREESSTNPLYFVLARHHTREHTSRIPVVTVRAIFSALAFLTMGALIYTLIKDISGSYADAFTKYVLLSKHDRPLYPCCDVRGMSTFMIYLTLISNVWIAYKESSWIRASLWIISLLFFGR
uniref:Uncharacterized protein n=1 Tax=Lactuca sativa TaxID=4236 RepID=A0A9R1WQ64_LACSA|nr:hypothetical protein LSAT_V11C100033590 [Lactuca sativa]